MQLDNCVEKVFVPIEYMIMYLHEITFSHFYPHSTPPAPLLFSIAYCVRQWNKSASKRF